MGITKLKRIPVLLPSALVLGVLMGGASAAFLTLLEWVTSAREHHLLFIAFLPAVGMLTAFYRRFGESSRRGNNLIIDSVHQQTRIPFRTAVFTFAFTILTHLTGGSVGREGTAVQIGGTLAHKLGKIFQLDEKGKPVLVMAGISAGFGSVFGTPLAGAFFGMEMCFVGKLGYEALLPCFIASFTADGAARLLGVSHAAYAVRALPPITFYHIAVTAAASCVFGVTGRLFAVSVRRVKKFYSRLIRRPVLRALAGSLIVLAVMLSCGAVKYDGLSTWMISAGFRGEVRFLDPVLKWILTVLSLGAGFQGGEVTPLFDIGAALGGLIGQAVHMEPSLLAALGFIAVFGCAANTPLTTVMLGIELFGAGGIPYYIIAALVSYYVSGHNGIYASQRIQVSKYPRRREDEGQTLEAAAGRSLLERVRKFRQEKSGSRRSKTR